MTHAFFKALMFMAAGSVIAAMAGEQNIDRMSGLRRAMPFTFAAFLVAALALSGVPGFSGYFSKDEILAFAAERGGGYWIFYAVGTLVAAHDRVLRVPDGLPRLRGRADAEARELEQGHLHHAEPRQPGHGRAGGHRRRLSRAPSTTSPSGSAGCGADGDPGRPGRSSRAWSRSPAYARGRELPRPDVRGLAVRGRRRLDRHRVARAGRRRASPR